MLKPMAWYMILFLLPIPASNTTINKKMVTTGAKNNTVQYWWLCLPHASRFPLIPRLLCQDSGKTKKTSHNSLSRASALFQTRAYFERVDMRPIRRSSCSSFGWTRKEHQNTNQWRDCFAVSFVTWILFLLVHSGNCLWKPHWRWSQVRISCLESWDDVVHSYEEKRGVDASCRREDAIALRSQTTRDAD